MSSGCFIDQTTGMYLIIDDNSAIVTQADRIEAWPISKQFV